jgi:hypothetical protein
MIPDLHAIEKRVSLDGNGYLVFKVFVQKKISTIDLESRAVYQIRTALKASIYNKNPVNISPGSLTAYMNYPAIFSFTKTLQCGDPAQAANFRLLTYSPITVNSSITTSRSDSTDNTLTSSSAQSVGSSNSQTNSFGINVQAGEMMESPMFTVGLSYEHAYASQRSQQHSTSSGSSSGQGSSIQDGYSIKDWGIYAKIDRENLKAGWICGQEYPWDVMQFRSFNGAGNIDLPQAIIDRMLMGDCVLPPSQLSQFGTDFTFTAEWSFTPDDESPDINANLLTFDVDSQYALATHQRLGIAGHYSISASLGSPAVDQTSLSLTWWQLECLALNPLVPGRNDASLNLAKLPATSFPTKPSVPLLIASPTNTLICNATGFEPGMIADVTSAPATYVLGFKVTDTVGDLSLLLKHWKLEDTGVVLSIRVNDVEVPLEWVDGRQGNGATGNRTETVLRTTDYMADDFCDYVKVGMNTITVTVTAGSKPADGQKVRYCLAAVVLH